MRRVVVGTMGTLSGLVLLFSYHTSLGGGTALAGGTTTAAGAGGTPTPTPTQSSSGSGPTGSGTSSSGTYTGSSVDTRWGPVQVQITVENGRITAAQAVVYPQENPRDQEINAYAVPQLNSEAVQANSGSIDAVSGATVTSDGYIQSLQSAIDQAHLS
jgi:uncharacterized protein with FMN-binding domain